MASSNNAIVSGGGDEVSFQVLYSFTDALWVLHGDDDFSHNLFLFRRKFKNRILCLFHLFSSLVLQLVPSLHQIILSYRANSVIKTIQIFNKVVMTSIILHLHSLVVLRISQTKKTDWKE